MAAAIGIPATASAHEGVAVSVEYTGDVVGPFAGAQNRGEYLDNLDIGVTLDMGRLAGWGGDTTVFVHLLNNSGGAPNDYAGSLQGVDNIEGTMRSEFIGNLGRTPKRDNHELMAEVFNSFDRQVEGRFMAQLGAKAHDSVERIKALMFVFDDLARLDGTGVQVLLRSIDKSDLCLAMKGASEAMSQLFFSNMSERGAKLLREEMQSVGPVRAKDVNAAQARIVATAKDLAARNELMLAGQSAEDELIY
ncbi:MAG: hypothetical protein K2P70_19540 [Hyphomonadaceae bacterium]|nr:hypothetical protein [Hyphomonadaceae bacterium]